MIVNTKEKLIQPATTRHKTVHALAPTQQSMLNTLPINNNVVVTEIRNEFPVPFTTKSKA